MGTWSFLGPVQERQVIEARSALSREDWQSAVRLNKALLAGAPPSIFSADPRLPRVLIRPAGSGVPDKPEKVVDGWRWRLEVAYLELYDLQPAKALELFDRIKDASPRWSAKADQGRFLSLIRLGRYAEAQEMMQEGEEQEGLSEVLEKAIEDGPDALIKLGDIAAQPRAVGPSLSGAIGGGPGVLLDPRNVTNSNVPKAGRLARVEAYLILAEKSRATERYDLARSHLLKAEQVSGPVLVHHARIARAIRKALP